MGPLGHAESQHMSNMYGAAELSAASRTSPETRDESVPDFVYDFVAAGLPWPVAVGLGRRVADTCQSLRDGLITEDEAEARIDRDAGAVFMSAAAAREAA